MLRNIFLIALLTICSISFGQIRQEIDQEALSKFKAKLEKERFERQLRVQKYLDEHPSIERVIKEADGNYSYIKDIENGKPVIVKVDNKGAAETTGAAALSSTGEFGVDLQGEGIKIGVWDGGYNLFTHQEYADRNTIGDGNEFGVSNHATHVMGTILASGVNERARGMAPKARGVSYGFGNDLAEMTAVATTETNFLLISNHSYGVRAGWNDAGTQWLGDPDVSEQEDWRFGYYNSDAANTDNLMYLAPYYLSVWSAGNQRGQGGNGPYPANGPYDILVGDKNAKNTLIVGAINKINGGYTGREDVVMSSFSCWGPTDDGRIKPDIVGAGVGIFSANSSSDSAYGNSQGTSMSAPNVSGSLILIQDLYSRLNAGNYLRSASMKALMFQTANDGGIAGPDYSHGWGVLNVHGMADLIIQSNNTNKAIRELVLNNGETYQLDFEPAPNTEVKATIVWTDLPGQPGPANTLDGDKLMLINDLDMRMSDGTNTFEPWILNPANPGAAATKGDNFRDNSEQVVFTSTDGAPITLTIGHKGELETGKQAFSLVLTYTPKVASNTFYWIGQAGGDWSNGANWSMNTGGEAASAVPGSNDIVIFDDNSFANDQTLQIDFNKDEAVGGLRWLATENSTVALGGFKLSVASDFVVGSNTTIQSGTIELLGSKSPNNKFVANGIDLSGLDVIVNSNTTEWSFVGETSLKSITVQSGKVSFDRATISIGDLTNSGDIATTISAEGTTFNISGNVNLNSSVNISDANSIYNLTSANGKFTVQGQTIEGAINVQGTVDFEGENNTLKTVDVADAASLNLSNDHTIENLTLQPGASLSFDPGKGVEVTGDLVATGQSDKMINLTGAIEPPGFVKVDGHRRVCLDFLNITDVDVVGTASVTAGANSTSSNDSWPLVACEDVLFSNFAVQYTCLNSLTNFTDASTGGILTWTWDFGDNSTSTDQNPAHVYAEAGTYEVTLRVEDGSSSKSYTQSVVIGDNDLESNTIVNNDGVLASSQQADSYQWYKDNTPIIGATQRTYNTQNENGVYFVVTFSETCNLKSNEVEVVVSSIEDEIVQQFERATTISPNPSEDQITISMVNDFYGSIQTTLIDLTGKRFLQEEDQKEDRSFSKEVRVESLPSGLYIVNLLIGNEIVINKKVLIK